MRAGAASRRSPRRGRVGAIVIALALVAALAPSGARAGRTVTILGRGWGHGLGMSQYGAYGRAIHGRSSRDILLHYYSGAHVGRKPMPRRVRVGLLQSKAAIHLTAFPAIPGRGRVVFKVAGPAGRIASGPAGSHWRVEPSSTGGARLYKNGKKVKAKGRTVFGSPSRPLVLVFAKHHARVGVRERGLRYSYGRLELGVYSPASCGAPFCLRLVLSLPMQRYILGLGEVPASWPQAALRAQAVAGRTYALRRIRLSGQHRDPCDCALYDTPVDQAYIGDAKRTGSGAYWGRWKRAVNGTNREVVTYHGAPIQALYSSSSGGHTENNENVWGGTPIPYLRGVRDAFDGVSANPNFRWKLHLGWARLSARLNSAYGVGKLKRIKLVRPFGVSGRVTVAKPAGRGGVRIVGRARTVRVDGWSVHSALNLRDTWFRVLVHFTAATALKDAYARSGGPAGPLGAATSGLRRSPGRRSSQRFAHGTIYRDLRTGGTHYLWGAIDSAYRKLGGPRSRCGPPTSDVHVGGLVARATFEHGTIASAARHRVRVRCDG